MQIAGQRGDEVWFDEQVKASGRQYPQVAVRRLVIAGPVVPGLVTAADGARLLVVGRSKGGVGPVVHGLVDDGACPVAVVRRHS